MSEAAYSDPGPQGAASATSAIAANGQPAGAERRARPVPRITIQAFCEDPDTGAIIQEAAADRRLAKTHVSVQMGGIPGACRFYADAPTPNLIIVESHKGRAELLADLEKLAEVCDAGTRVIVIGRENDVWLYRELIRRGVSEYLVPPLTPLQVMESISSLYTDPESAPLGDVYVFVGAKGGVGSSTICHNTAWAISRLFQNDVAIADFDLAFGTAGLNFNQDPMQGLADALFATERLDAVMLDRLLAKCSEHLSLLAAPATLDSVYDIAPEACEQVLDVVRETLPAVAVDVPHLWTDWARQILFQADEVVITATPDLASLRNTKSLLDLLQQTRKNDRPPFLVLNQVGMPKRPEISVSDFASALEMKPTLVIDFDAQLFGTAANNGQMIEEISPKAKAAGQFQDLARHLTNRQERKSESASLLAPLLSRFSLKKAG